MSLLSFKKIHVLFLALFISLFLQGYRGLYDRDETRYAEIAREMLLTHEYVIPLRDFHPHLTKPPLTYWALALSMQIFGVNEWGARIPNALAFSFTAFLVAWIGKYLWDERHGVLAGIIYTTSLVPYIASHIVTTDTLLVLWEVAAVFFFIKGYLKSDPTQARRTFIFMCVFWGLAFLTKGVAIAPVVAALFFFWLIKRKTFKVFPLSFWGIVLFVLIGMSWYIFLIFKIKDSLSIFLEEQIIGRLFKDLYHRNSEWYAPFYIYLPLFTLGALPWSIIWVPTFKKEFKNLKEVFKGFSSYKRLFLFLWFFIPLAIFWLAKSRLPLYILPIFTPLSLATARKWYLLNTEKRSYLGNFFMSSRFVLSWIGFLLLAKLIFIYYPAPQNAKIYSSQLKSYLKNRNCFLALGQPYYDGMAFYTGINWQYLPSLGEEKKPYVEISWEDLASRLKEEKKTCIILSRKNKIHGLKKKISSLGLKVRLLKKTKTLRLYEIKSL